MTQESIILRTEGPPYEGVNVLIDTNNALATVASDFAGPVDPALDETKGVKAYMTWADTLNELMKRRNADNTAWVVTGPMFMSMENLRWFFQPLGIPIPILDHIPGVPIPPTDNIHFRYIKLTAADAYNTGVLTDETVTGVAPLVLATAVITLAGSPIDGAVVDLVNTSRRALRGGNSGDVEQDAFQNITGSAGLTYSPSDLGPNGALSLGLYGNTPPGTGVVGTDPGFTATLNFNAANSPGARTANETRTKNLGVSFYMRIM